MHKINNLRPLPYAIPSQEFLRLIQLSKSLNAKTSERAQIQLVPEALEQTYIVKYQCTLNAQGSVLTTGALIMWNHASPLCKQLQVQALTVGFMQHHDLVQ